MVELAWTVIYKNIKESRLIDKLHDRGCMIGCQIGCDHLNTELSVQFSSHGLNKEPFSQQTTANHLNTKLVWYLNPQCT